MAQYPSVVVTNKGHDLISTANATNKAVRYIKAVVGDGQLNNQSIESLTAMIAPKLELPSSMGVDLGDGQWRISFALSNSTVTNGFYAREVGVFAKLDGQDDSTAILFGYTNGGNHVDYIPPKTTPIDSQIFNCDFVIGDAENVTVNILDGTFVTHQALTNAIDIHNTATDSHQPILNAIKAISGMSEYDIAPSKTIAAIIQQVNNMITKSDIQVITGEVANGGTIPLPDGFLESECKWFAGIKHSNVYEWRIDPEEGKRSNLLAPMCTLNGRVVTVGTQVAGLDGGSYTQDGPVNFGMGWVGAFIPGTAWYICIGIHR